MIRSLGNRVFGTTVVALFLGMISLTSAAKVALVGKMSSEEKVALNSRWDLGYYLFQIQEFNAAAREFEKIRIILPNDPSLLALIGSCYSMAGRWQEGEVALLSARNQNPEDDDINGLLGQFYISSGKQLKGVAYLEHSLQISPEQDDLRARLASVYLENGQYDRAVLHLEHLLLLHGGISFDNPELDYDYARCMLHSGKFREGLFFARKAHQAQPLNWGYARVLGLCLLGNNQYSEAVEMLSVGKDESYAEADMYLQLGEAQFLDRQWVDAEKTWLKGLGLYQKSYDLYSRLIEYYISVAKPEMARRVAKVAETRNPGHPGNHLLQARLKRKMNSYAEALKSVERLKRQSCGTLAKEALWEEAQLDFAMGQYSDCKRILDGLLVIKHRGTEVHLMKAKLAYQGGDKAAAEAELLKARIANPYNMKVYAFAKEAFSSNAALANLPQP